MKNKYFIPTVSFIEQGGLKNVAELVPPSCKNVLIVTGKHSAKKFGFTDVIINSLKSVNKNFFLFDDVEENPSVETADAAAALARKNNCEAVIGIGGGSPLDAAKAAAVSAAEKISVAELLETKQKSNKKLFFVAVPTTAGTGSEATQYSLLTDKEKNTKQNLATENSFPDIALLDARLTVTMSKSLTKNTGLDALSHAIEGYLITRSTPFTDLLAEEAVKIIAENLKTAINEPENISAREKMLLASNIAGRVIAHTGTSACHALGYYLTLVKGVPHGLANAVLLGRVVNWVKKYSQEKVAVIEKILKTSVDDFIESFDVNTSLAHYKMTESDIETMAELAATRGSTKATPGSPTKSQLIDLF